VWIVQIVSMLEYQHAGSWQSFRQFLSNACEHWWPARNRARMRAHVLECGLAEGGQAALPRRDWGGKEEARVSIFGTEPDPDDIHLPCRANALVKPSLSK
jgi:hypothetical protein